MTLNVSNIIIWSFTFSITIIFFTFALNRQTIISGFLSWLSWWSLGYVTLSGVVTVGALAIGFMWFCMLVGIIMMLATFKFTFDFWQEAMSEKKRRVSEEIM